MEGKFLIRVFKCLSKEEKISYIDNFICDDIEKKMPIVLSKENKSLEVIPFLKIVLKNHKYSKDTINKMIFDNLLSLSKFDVALSFNKSLSKWDKRKLISTNISDKHVLTKNNKFISIMPTACLTTILVIEGLTILSNTYNSTTVSAKSPKTMSNNSYLEKNTVSEFSDEEIMKTIETVNNELANNTVKFTYNDKEYVYVFSDLGFSLNKENVLIGLKENDIVIDYNLKNTILNSVDLLSNNISYDDEKVNNVVSDVYNKTKVNKVDGVITKLDGNVIRQTNGVNGLELNTDDLKEKLKGVQGTNKENVIELSMNETKAEVSTREIYSGTENTISSVTTYYNAYVSRATNVENAARKLNGKVLLPGEVFSYLKTVGPYNSGNGYVFYDKDVGYGVCQVASTLYNAQLKAGLETVSRTNHYDPVSYVAKGLDATVYGSSIDYQFRNNSDYPITIVASASGGVLTVGISGDSNILGGKSYAPRAVYISNKVYDAYLDVYQDGNVIESRYLGRSYYKY